MNSGDSGPKLTTVQWLICIIAAIGFAFDTYELLMLPLVVRPALQELIGVAPGTPEFASWVGKLFYVPAFAGGLFGLLGGYLTDRLGRRRVLTWSILIYAFSAFASGFSTSPQMLLFFRCTTFIGVCVEFVAAVAWLAELFAQPAQREKVIGYTQAFASVGGLLVAFANSFAISHAATLPAAVLPEWLNFFGGTIKDSHAAWRYTLMSGLIPALPLIIIRPFLPESPVWQKKRTEGTLKRPSIAELFSPELARTTIITTIIFACSYGAAFGSIQQIQRIVPGLPEVKEQVKGKPVPAQKKIEQEAGTSVTKVQEVGGLVGRFLLAVLVVRVASWQRLLRIFQTPGLILMPLVFGVAAVTSMKFLYVGIFFAGLVTVAQFSFWGNYLPHVYPVHLRGTGESFAANIGGRMIGTCFAWVTSELAVKSFMPGGAAETKLAYAAAAIGFFVYAVGLIASRWLPEPKASALSE